MYTIYALRDPRDLQIHYVGLTENHPVWRLVQHLQDKKDMNREKSDWLAELKVLNARPDVTILQFASDYETALFYERYWIKAGLRAGWPLINHESKYKPKEPKIVIRVPSSSEKATRVPPPRPAMTQEQKDLIAEIRNWRLAHPEGTQSQVRKYLTDKGMKVVRSTVHRIWHDSGDKLGTDITGGAA